jgi:DNA ligase-1
MKPMLAATYDEAKAITYPVLASPKLDGIRCLIIDGIAMSRSLKPIRNAYIQSILSNPMLNGLDGELIVGAPNDPDVYRTTSSGVMSEDGSPDFLFLVFDDYLADGTFNQRLESAIAKIKAVNNSRVIHINHKLINSSYELAFYEKESLEANYEGIMIRDPNGSYKQGRSTLREGGLIKVKRFSDSEIRITGFEELMHNNNEATVNELGRSERSNHQENMVPGNTLGTIIGMDLTTNQEVRLGSGFKQEERDYIWLHRATLIGKLAKYKYFAIGGYDKPRFPTFIGFRDTLDL